MKFLRIVVSVFLLIASVNSANAQAPGFMGKKNLLTTRVYFCPEVYPVFMNSYNYQGTELEPYSFRSTFDLTYTRCVSRNMTLGLSIEKFRTGTDYQYYGDSLRRIRNTAVMGVLQMFPFVTLGNVAPYGFFFEFRTGLSTAKVTEYHIKPDIESEYSLKFRTNAMTAGIGYNNIFLDRIIVNLGARIGLFFYGLGLDDPRFYRREYINSRVFYYQSFNLNVGTGFLF